MTLDKASDNVKTASSPFNNEFGKGQMFVQLANHTLPTHTQTQDDMMTIDTYYRQTHLPKKYYEAFINKTAVDDYTCTREDYVSIYRENPDFEYACYCYANSYMGMPDLQVVFYEEQIQFSIPVEQYMFTPYLNYTTGNTHCVLGIAGPTKVMTED